MSRPKPKRGARAGGGSSGPRAPRRRVLDVGQRLPPGLASVLAGRLWRWVQDTDAMVRAHRRQLRSTGEAVTAATQAMFALAGTAAPSTTGPDAAAWMQDAGFPMLDSIVATIDSHLDSLDRVTTRLRTDDADRATLIRWWPHHRADEAIFAVLASLLFSDRLIARTLWPRLREPSALARIYQHRTRCKGVDLVVPRYGFALAAARIFDEIKAEALAAGALPPT